MKKYTTQELIYIQFIYLCNELKKPCYIAESELKKMIKDYPYFPEIDIKGSPKIVGSWKLDKFRSFGWTIEQITNEHGGVTYPVTNNRFPTKDFSNALYLARLIRNIK